MTTWKRQATQSRFRNQAEAGAETEVSKPPKKKAANRVLQLAISVCGLGVMFSPLPHATKLIVGLSGSALCFFQVIEIRSERERIAKFKVNEAAELEAKATLIEAKSKELDAGLAALEVAEAELNSKKRIAEAEAQSSREALKAELAREQDKLLLDLEAEERRRRHKLEADLEANKAAILAQMELTINEKKTVIDALDREQAEKLQRLEDELGQRKALLEAELAQLEAQRQQQLEAIAVEERQRLGAIEAEIEAKRAQWTAERQAQKRKDAAELEEAEEALTNQYIESRDQMLADLKDLEAQLNAQARANFESWLVPHCQEMDSKIREIEALKGTVQMLREQIAESRDIKLSGLDGTEEGDRADKILIWLKEQGQYCDYCSATILPDGTFVLNFMPWVVGSKTEKAIKGLLVWMVPKFSLREPPLFQPNGEARAWTLTMIPIRSRANGRSPEMNLTRLDDFYSRHSELDIRTGETFRDLESDIREGVARQLNYEAQVNEMMAFRPPVPLPKPRSHQITELEMMCCKWFYFWRGLATDGEEPNVTTREGLLFYVYGVREGRATSNYDPIMCESLGQRVKRILDMLRVEAVELEEQAEGEE